MATLCLLAIVAVLVCSCHVSRAGVVNAPNNGYTRWPQTSIPYKIAGLTGTDPTRITDAMNQISADTGACINFVPYNPAVHSNQPFLAIQPRFSNPNTPNQICWTYPGYTTLAGNNGQIMTMFSSTSGNAAGNCLDNKRDTMRTLMNAIGVRNEYSRSDRDTFMTFTSQSGTGRNGLVHSTLQIYNMFEDSAKYTAAQTTITTPGVFDFDSITMVSGTKFALNQANPVFRTSQTVGTNARLSINDCSTLKALYSCPQTGTGATPTCQSLSTAPVVPGQVVTTPAPINNGGGPFEPGAGGGLPPGGA